MTLNLRLGRWRCRNPACERQTFTERLLAIAAPLARRTCRVAELVRLLGHTATIIQGVSRPGLDTLADCSVGGLGAPHFPSARAMATCSAVLGEPAASSSVPNVDKPRSNPSTTLLPVRPASMSALSCCVELVARLPAQG